MKSMQSADGRLRMSQLEVVLHFYCNQFEEIKTAVVDYSAQTSSVERLGGSIHLSQNSNIFGLSIFVVLNKFSVINKNQLFRESVDN